MSIVVFSFVAGGMLWLDGGTPPTAALRVSLLCPLGHLCSGMPRTGVSLLGDPTSQCCTTASFKLPSAAQRRSRAGESRVDGLPHVLGNESPT